MKFTAAQCGGAAELGGVRREEGDSTMHHLMVGVRLSDSRPEFFGWDEVNGYLRHGMRVVRVEPGGVFGLPPPDGDPSVSPLEAWYFTVVLDDSGIDPAWPNQSP